jgi:hypothetical protein
MKFILYIVLILLSINCNRKNYPESVESNRALFKMHLSIINKIESGKGAVYVDDYRSAINFLSIVTGINSKADYSSTIGYMDKNDFKSDMKKWKKWYKTNSFKLTDQYIDSAFKSVGIKE